jgi:hypothetical protein
MLYVFHGREIIHFYEPIKEHNPYDYSIMHYYAKRHQEVEWKGFHSKTTDEKLHEGQKVTINGEILYINTISYNMDNDCYDCYTNKVISDTQNIYKMTEKEACDIANEWKREGGSIFQKIKNELISIFKV